ncbi:peroxiredoxin [Cyanobium sp. Cruz CV13-4-11]|jgi:thioredoxin-dependent peroxiredoxin|uniref:peroxiredoxin n=1 Tax=unclassified Cyanobium TaxID=2627006 RepID=UPI0020CCD2F2|nr:MULTISPECIES: peroxiredoxin [unclassified Cyanobium]MCP9900418.1 peroxiredoxin [Cyanobium sp. Cruz CV11-17]MCP9919501.1 peroxiredoxin [Cyanobium sp. Cruz CV13-4-11]
MERRGFLVGAALAGVGLLVRPARAGALGGTLPAIDQPAPAFDLDGVAPGVDGTVRQAHLATDGFRGRWLILYFYPKDFTSGCTLEARGFQRDLASFHSLNAEVVGVSADDAEAHLSFCGSEGLAYPLLSDPGGLVSRRYGSWLAPFSARHTFLIDPDGVLRSLWTAVRPAGHAQEVLTELQRIQNSGDATIAA